MESVQEMVQAISVSKWIDSVLLFVSWLKTKDDSNINLIMASGFVGTKRVLEVINV